MALNLFSIFLFYNNLAPQAPPQSSYGNNRNWNIPQNGPAAATGPPGQTGPGPQSELYYFIFI